MTVADPETGAITHRQDDPDVVEHAADELCKATAAIERVDYNALREDDLQTVLAVKQVLHDLTKDLRCQERHRRNAPPWDGDSS